MATFIFDLDGTIVTHGTNDLLPGADALLTEVSSGKHQVIFTTRRGDDFPFGHIYGRGSTVKLIDSLTKQYNLNVLATVFNCDSPRIVVNDDGCAAIKHAKNDPIKYTVAETLSSILNV